MVASDRLHSRSRGLLDRIWYSREKNRFKKLWWIYHEYACNWRIVNNCRYVHWLYNRRTDTQTCTRYCDSIILPFMIYFNETAFRRKDMKAILSSLKLLYISVSQSVGQFATTLRAFFTLISLPWKPKYTLWHHYHRPMPTHGSRVSYIVSPYVAHCETFIHSKGS